MAEILQYVNGNGIIHRLHPVVKVLFIATMSVMAVLASDITILLALTLVIAVLARVGGLHREIIQQLGLLLMMSVVLVAITVLTIPSGDVITTLVPAFVPFIGGAIPVTTGGLEFGIVLTLRFIILITTFQLVVISTQPRDIIHTMERVHIPPDYVLMFLIALRFIPTLQTEGRRIHEAQLARAYDPGPGVRGKIRSVAPVAIPLVSNALARTTVLGLTIDMRGYRTRPRTIARDRPFARPDWTACLLFLVGWALYITRAVTHGI